MKRILIISDDPWALGPNDQSVLVANGLAQAGWSVSFVQLHRQTNQHADFPQTTNLTGVDERYYVSWRRRLDTTAIRRLRSILKRYQPALVHAWGTSATRAAAAMCLGKQQPLVFSHDLGIDGTMFSSRWSDKLAGSQAHLHLFSDAQFADRARRAHKNWRRVAALPWGRPSSEPVQVDHTEDIKRKLEIPIDAKLVGVVAPLRPRNRLKDFVWAADLVACIRDDIYWLVIGDGRQRWRLEKFVGQLDTRGRLRILGWHEKTLDFVSALDVYVQPGAWVADGNGIMAAMQSAVPLVLTSDQRHRGFVQHGASGYIVETGARNEIARCVTRLINQPELARRMGLRAKQTWIEHFNFTATMDRLCTFYSGLLQGNLDLHRPSEQAA